MDLYCPKCGEPWENDTFHDVADETNTTYAHVTQDFRSRGCEALGAKHNTVADESRDDVYGLSRSQAAAALYDLLGDDMDGAASMLDDLDFESEA